MKAITSRDNPLYKHLKTLARSSPQQKKSGQVLLEGFHLARAYLDTASHPDLCLVTEATLRYPEAQALMARIDPARQVTLPETLFDQLSNVVNGVGLLLVVPRPTALLPDKVETTCVVLDRLQDAGNVGSILRSAAAAGVHEVFCTAGTAYAWSSKVLRAAMGAHFLLRIHEDIQADALLERLAMPVVITDSHASCALYDCDLSRPLAWVFGNEGSGVSDRWAQVASYRLKIPQRGAMESLNVAAAAAICLFEQCRQGRGK